MRIALLTVNVYDNYGNTLQKYALYRTLEKFADRVEVFWHHASKQFTAYDLELSPSFTGNVRASAFKCVRENKFKEFDDTHMRTRFDLPDLEDVADDYDFFVVGSDQVWNPDLWVPGNFLEFAPPEKRIAYAASIAVPEVPANLVDYYRAKISEMPYVSIREAEGVDLVEKITGKRPLRVLDPVFLLDADEWREIAKPPRWLSRKTYENGYLLSYFFDGKPPEQVRALADKLNLPVVNLLDLNNFDQYITGIEEFLYLVDHATLMCTQSFHGTAFAINFKTPVIVYKVQIGRMVQRFSRLESLLGLFGLSDRATDVDLELKMEDPLQIDFTRRDEAIVAERTKALTFLKVALGLLPQDELPIEPPKPEELPPVIEEPVTEESATEEPAQDELPPEDTPQVETSEADESSQVESSEVTDNEN